MTLVFLKHQDKASTSEVMTDNYILRLNIFFFWFKYFQYDRAKPHTQRHQDANTCSWQLQHNIFLLCVCIVRKNSLLIMLIILYAKYLISKGQHGHLCAVENVQAVVYGGYINFIISFYLSIHDQGQIIIGLFLTI